MDKIMENGCIKGWSSERSEVNGECPDCGYPTIDGGAASGCFYSPTTCETCGHSPCDRSCQKGA